MSCFRAAQLWQSGRNYSTQIENGFIPDDRVGPSHSFSTCSLRCSRAAQLWQSGWNYRTPIENGFILVPDDRVGPSNSFKCDYFDYYSSTATLTISAIKAKCANSQSHD